MKAATGKTNWHVLSESECRKLRIPSVSYSIVFSHLLRSLYTNMLQTGIRQTSRKPVGLISFHMVKHAVTLLSFFLTYFVSFW